MTTGILLVLNDGLLDVPYAWQASSSAGELLAELEDFQASGIATGHTVTMDDMDGFRAVIKSDMVHSKYLRYRLERHKGHTTKLFGAWLECEC